MFYLSVDVKYTPFCLDLNLTATGGTYVLLDPVIGDTTELKKWYGQEGAARHVDHVGVTEYKAMTLAEAVDTAMCEARRVFAKVVVIVKSIDDSDVVYRACNHLGDNQKPCNKKLADDKCAVHNKNTGDKLYRYI
jgi:hypothetical protein